MGKMKRGQGWTQLKKKSRKKNASQSVDDVLRDVYYNYGEEGALQNNPEKLLASAQKTNKRRRRKITLKQIHSFLSKQPSYTVHRRVQKRQFPRRKFLITSSKARIDADLLELRDLEPWNSGHNYALILIDAFSRYVWGAAIKNKESKTVSDAYEKLYAGDKDERLQALTLYTDGGTEFSGSPFQSMLKKKGIRHKICTSEDFHCPFVERVIRTIKEKMFQALTTQHSRRWIDLLPKVISTYNKTVHSSIGMTPEEASSPLNYLAVLKKNYIQPLEKSARRTAPPKYKFAVGDLVRILKQKNRPGMDKGYLPNYSWEIFRIKQRANNRPNDKDRIPAYVLEDLNGEEIENALFYEPELVYVHPDQLKGPAPIREILKQTKDRVLVWFQGHPQSSAVWLPRENLV